MMGWRGRIGFLVPPGNPTVEPEMMGLAPSGVSLHFTRMVAHGTTGAHAGQEDRNRTQIEHLADNVALLAMVKPSAIVMAHTATSYTLGMAGEDALVQRMQSEYGIPFITAFGSVVEALRHRGICRVAYGTPYDEATTEKGKRHLEAYGFQVVSHRILPGVTNIYDESHQRAYQLARAVDCPEADAVLLSGVGMPTIAALDMIEQDLGKPAMSSASAMMWNALRIIGVNDPATHGGSLLTRVAPDMTQRKAR